MPRTALVTDSTAMLPASLAAERGITVVPLQVVIGAKSYDEGVDAEATPDTIAEALKQFTPVSTSRPTPATFLAAYERAAAEGAEAVLSVHLSGEVSGTYESAQLAAREASLPVLTVDTRQLGMATGYAVLAAADVLDAGKPVEEAAGAALARASATTSLFYVDTLEYLRRGGRIGAAAAVLGSALAVKPLLTLTDGRIAPLEKVRTTARALSRLEELAVAAAEDRQVDVAVAHLAGPARAEALADRLRARLAASLDGREVFVGEVGAVIGAHVGPGMVAVVVAPR
ncbi:MAG: DegV family protein [Nocardioides sp.]